MLMKGGKDIAPVVSIIMPTYNRAEFISAAISSVLRQTYESFELIVIDDGSTDETAQVIRSFTDQRVLFVRQANHGRSAARNRALGMARGRYIAFLDSDDEYLPDKLSLQVAYMDRHPDIGMIYTSAQCINAAGEPLDGYDYVATAQGNIYRDIAFFRPVTITLPTVMLRREVLDIVGLFDVAMERFEDTDLWRRIAKRFRIGVIESPTCRLRTHTTNILISQNPELVVAAIDYYVSKIFQEDADVEISFLRHGASGLYAYYGKAFVSVPGWRRRGFALISRAILLCPSRIAHVAFAGMGSLLRSLIRQYFVTNSGQNK
jgi:glycosyltransferase involved in cell wall biosynthesis